VTAAVERVAGRENRDPEFVREQVADDHRRGVGVGAIVDVGFHAVEAPYHIGR
jgi:hypothetical protein